MKTYYLPILYIILSSLFTSCSPQFYAPTTAMTPLFREKGETQLSGHIGSGDEIDRIIQIQGACAIDSHLAILGTLYTAESSYHNNAPISVNAGKGSQVEIAMGYYKPISPGLSYELYGVLALGEVKNNFEKKYSSFSLATTKFEPIVTTNKCFKPFVQANMGYRSKYFDAAFNMRIGFLHIGAITETTPSLDTSFKSPPVQSLEKIKSNPNSFLIEPGFTIRCGYEPIKLQLHLGKSFSSNGSNYPIDGTVLTLGIVGMINSSTVKNKRH